MTEAERAEYHDQIHRVANTLRMALVTEASPGPHVLGPALILVAAEAMGWSPMTAAEFTEGISNLQRCLGEWATMCRNIDPSVLPRESRLVSVPAPKRQDH